MSSSPSSMMKLARKMSRIGVRVGRNNKQCYLLNNSEGNTVERSCVLCKVNLQVTHPSISSECCRRQGNSGGARCHATKTSETRVIIQQRGKAASSREISWWLALKERNWVANELPLIHYEPPVLKTSTKHDNPISNRQGTISISFNHDVDDIFFFR